MAKSLSHFKTKIWRCSFHSKVVWRCKHWKVVYQDLEKNSKTSFSEMVCLKKQVFSRAKCRLSGNKKNFVRKTFSNENCTSLIYFVERNPLRSISVIFVERICFWTHCRVLPVRVGDSKCARNFCHARRLGHFTREITLNNKYLSQFLPDRKVL